MAAEMKNLELVINEEVVSEVTAISRVFIGKDNKLGLRIGKKPVMVKRQQEDGSVKEEEVTVVALFTFDGGEVVIRNIYAEKMDDYHEEDRVVTILASSFFNNLSVFGRVAGGASLEVDDQNKVVWFCSKDGGLRLKAAIQEPMLFSKAKPENYIDIMVSGDALRRACGAVSGLNAGFCYDGAKEASKLVLYCGDGNQFVKSLVDIKKVATNGDLSSSSKIDIMVSYKSVAKISSLFTGQSIKVILTKEKLIVRDKFSWYEAPLLLKHSLKRESIELLDKLSDSEQCVCMIRHDMLTMALSAMRAATATLKAESAQDVYLYMEYTDLVRFYLRDNSQMVFDPIQIAYKEGAEKRFQVAFSQDIFERSIAKLGNMDFLVAGMSYTADKKGAVITMHPGFIKDGNGVIDETVTTYGVSILYSAAYKDKAVEASDAETAESDGAEEE